MARTDVAARSDRGRVREDNEDRWLAHAYGRTMLLAVADGVGGEPGGELASDAAIKALAREFADARPRDGARAALAGAIRKANDAVLATADGGHPFAASTLVAAAISGGEAAIANLGDSRAYIVRADAARQVTTDHSGERASSITRFVGDPRGVQPDIFVERLERGDRLVLCSDGLTRHVGDAEIARAVRDEPAKAVAALVTLANERGGEDNVTVVVYAARGRRDALRAALVVLLAIALGVALGIAAATFAPAGTDRPAAPLPAATATP